MTSLKKKTSKKSASKKKAVAKKSPSKKPTVSSKKKSTKNTVGKKVTKKKAGGKIAGKKTKKKILKKSASSTKRKKTTESSSENLIDNPRVVTAEIVDEELDSPRFSDGFSEDNESQYDGDSDENFESDDFDSNLSNEISISENKKVTRNKDSISRSSEPSNSKALSVKDPVAAYLAEIRKYPLLSKEEEKEVALKYAETGDPLLAETLVTSNLRFVVKVAAEYARFGAKLIDLIQEGNVGLMHAVKEFNPYKGVRLITYAVWWIRGYIQEYLMRQYSMVRIGTTQNQRKLFYKLQKERDLLEQKGFTPTDRLISEKMGIPESDVKMMSQRMSRRDMSLNQPLDDSSSATLMDLQKTDDEDSIDEQLSQMELLERLNQNIDKVRPDLSEKELFLLENRLLADEPMTLQEIGDKYKVTREAVRQMEVRLMGKIKKVFMEDVIELSGSMS